MMNLNEPKEIMNDLDASIKFYFGADIQTVKLNKLIVSI